LLGIGGTLLNAFTIIGIRAQIERRREIAVFLAILSQRNVTNSSSLI
jgi:hypothetical protein